MRYFNYTLMITVIILLVINSGISQDTTLSVTSDGNVGIGTTSPTDKLVIGDDFGFKLSGTRLTIGNNSGPSGINIGTGINQRALIVWDNNLNHLAIGTHSGGNTYGQTLVLKDGKVGSGTYNPTEKLDINGNIAVKGTVDGVDVSDLKTDFDNRQSGYVEFGNLNFPKSVGGSWTKMTAIPGTFTKSFDDSKIEVYFDGLVRLLNMNGVEATQVRIRIDDTVKPQFENYGVLLTIVTFPTRDHISIKAVFEGLEAGSHSVSLWARNRPLNATSIVQIDPGNYGGKIIVKETW